MNNIKKIVSTLIVAVVLITNVPGFITNIVKEKQLRNNYEQLEEKKKNLEQDYNEIIQNDKEDQYYRDKYNLSSKDDVLFEFPKE